MQHASPHLSVFQNELVDALALKPGDRAIDCTAGYGGHTAGLLEKVGPSGHVIAFDRDPAAISFLERRFPREISSGQLTLVHAPFSNLSSSLDKAWQPIQGICADLGVSSPQFDQAERGFSFQHDGPLDMRMDSSAALTAADIVNHADKVELVRILRHFGEEPKAPFIADAIIKRRQASPISRTSELANIIEGAVFYQQRSRRHPATRSFQALRIAVNGELDELKGLCESAFHQLAIGGRMAIISFHSLEDRLVKQAMRTFSQAPLAHQRQLRDLPYIPQHLLDQHIVPGRIVRPFPIKPSEAEMAANPRSRSAKLRVIEKVANISASE